jgi:pyrroloquinoline quinone (PQQ) biosynthesis protein C
LRVNGFIIICRRTFQALDASGDMDNKTAAYGKAMYHYKHTFTALQRERISSIMLATYVMDDRLVFSEFQRYNHMVMAGHRQPCQVAYI